MQYTMFCNQCEQAENGIGCKGKSGECGKRANISFLQDELTNEVIVLANCCRKTIYDEGTVSLMIRGLMSTVSSVNFDEDALKELLDKLQQERKRINQEDRRDDFECPLEKQPFELLLLIGLKGFAVYLNRCRNMGIQNQKASEYFIDSLCVIGKGEHWADLYQRALDLGEMNLMVLRDLDQAHCDQFGNPSPIVVSSVVAPGPFILVAGHDLKILDQVLFLADSTSVMVYTYGEMLSAHGYPGIRNHQSLKGHIGSSWQSQRRDFEGIRGPILLTDNCIKLGQESYQDRLYTTGEARVPGGIHLESLTDYDKLVEKAIDLKGFVRERRKPGLNNGTILLTGYGRVALTEQMVNMWNSYQEGKISHFIVIGGCDGDALWRSYYTRLVQIAPPNVIFITFGCCKYRFLDFPMEKVDGFPRILDAGQCNDLYGLLAALTAMAKTGECHVNQLPVTYFYSWYGQSAVTNFLTLMYFGIRHMFLGPQMPSFFSPEVCARFMIDDRVRVISTPEKDLEKAMGSVSGFQIIDQSAVKMV